MNGDASQVEKKFLPKKQKRKGISGRWFISFVCVAAGLDF
jgi:hypothetical protein